MKLPKMLRAQAMRTCGCCGRDLRGRQVTELGATRNVYICRPCALWAARCTKRS